MKMRFPLLLQIVAVFLANLALLFVINLFFFSAQFHLGWESLLYGPIGEKVQSIAFQAGRQFQVLPVSQWKHILEEYEHIYGVKFYLFDRQGKQLAGDEIKVPPEVERHIKWRPKFKLPPTALPFSETDAENKQDAQSLISDKPENKSEINKQNQQKIECEISQLPEENGAAHINTAPVAASDVPPDMRPDGAPSLTVHPFPFPHPMGVFFAHTSSPDMMWIGSIIRANPHDREPGTFLAATPNLWQTKLILDMGHILVACLLIFMLSLIVWWPFVFGITKALDKLTSATEKIAEGQFDSKITIKRPDEIGRLAQAINVMSSQLSMYVSGQKRFLGDTAHELCSPVARLQVAIEILEPTCNEKQAETLKDIREDVEQMSSLINELLAFSKAGIIGKDLELVPVDIGQLLQRIMTKASNELFTLELGEKLKCLGDELLLERAFGNILRNSERYAAGTGAIHIDAQKLEKEVVVKISDNGPGVPAEAIELLGQPFYRPEPSRNRNFGGVGLGLAIVKTCIEACNGSLSFRNRKPKGFEVEVRLKLVQEL